MSVIQMVGQMAWLWGRWPIGVEPRVSASPFSSVVKLVGWMVHCLLRLTAHSLQCTCTQQ